MGPSVVSGDTRADSPAAGPVFGRTARSRYRRARCRSPRHSAVCAPRASPRSSPPAVRGDTATSSGPVPGRHGRGHRRRR